MIDRHHYESERERYRMLVARAATCRCVRNAEQLQGMGPGASLLARFCCWLFDRRPSVRIPARETAEQLQVAQQH
jgi:hypothetical protein